MLGLFYSLSSNFHVKIVAYVAQLRSRFFVVRKVLQGRII